MGGSIVRRAGDRKARLCDCLLCLTILGTIRTMLALSLGPRHRYVRRRRRSASGDASEQFSHYFFVAFAFFLACPFFSRPTLTHKCTPKKMIQAPQVCVGRRFGTIQPLFLCGLSLLLGLSFSLDPALSIPSWACGGTSVKLRGAPYVTAQTGRELLIFININY